MGSFEEAKGRVKEAAGDLAGNQDLEREGEAQAEKGEAQREAHEAEAKVKGHEAEARENELRERAAQESK